MTRFAAALICLSLALGCKEPFIAPASKDGPPHYLVVDGFIEAAPGQARIKLAYTRGLSDTLPALPETNAAVFLVGADGTNYPFSNYGQGDYMADQLPLDLTQTYQLYVRNSEGKEFQSDAIQPLRSPDIDSVSWQLSAEGVNVYVSTHDPGSSSRYYRWQYIETWEHRAKFTSLLVYRNHTLSVRDPADQIFQCWKSDTISRILVGTSGKLQQDVISQLPVQFIPQGDDRISHLYSIIVYQEKINADAFAYWENLQKTTELRGSIFDPQPSELRGNMHCVTVPEEPVLGYVSAGTVTSKRIFIDNDDLAYWYYKYPYECSVPVDINGSQIDHFLSDSILFVPLSIGTAGVGVTGTECGDCRYNGGSNVKPPFFP